MKKINDLFYFCLGLILIAFISRIFSIMFFAGDYNIIQDTISLSGNFYVGSEFNLIAMGFFALFCITNALIFIVIYFVVSKMLYIKMRIFNISLISGFILFLIIPLFPSDLLLIPHGIVVLLLIISILVDFIMSIYITKNQALRLLMGLSLIFLTIWMISGIINLFIVFPTGIFEKLFVYCNMIWALFLIYDLTSNYPVNHPNRKRKKNRNSR